MTRYRQHLYKQYTQSNTYYDQHYRHMPELQQYEYRDLISVRKEILNRFEWVINELEQTIENLQKKGLRTEEFDYSNLMPELMAIDDDGEQVFAVESAGLCCYKNLWLSVIPVVKDAHRQLRFANQPGRKLTRI